MTVTRIHIADLVGYAFGPSGADKAELLSAAEDKDASSAILAQLERLPERHYRTMRDLWSFLEGVPVD